MEITKEELKELTELASGTLIIDSEELKELKSIEKDIDGESTEIYCFLQFGKQYKRKIDVTEPLKALLAFIKDNKED